MLRTSEMQVDSLPADDTGMTEGETDDLLGEISQDLNLNEAV